MLNYAIVIYLLVAWFVASSIYRFFKQAARSKIEVSGLPPQYKQSLPALLIPFAVLCLAISIFSGARLFFVGRLLISIIALAGALLFAATVEVVSAIKYPAYAKVKHWRLAMHILAVLAGLGALSFIIFLKSIPGSNAEAIQLAYPVKGEWKAATGGRAGLTNYHHNNPPAQNYAIDLVRAQGNSEGEIIFSPLAGLVVEAVNDRGPGSAEAEGNFIIIRSDNHINVHLAHLQQGSVLVQKGERVFSGMIIAKCGATGSAESAHLHIHAEKDGKPVPMVFGKRNSWLLRNSLFHN